MSCVRCPYYAKLLPPFFSALNRIFEPPSSIMLSKPISSASSSTLLATNTSTLITVDGRGSCYISEAITRPSLFQMTTPRLALLSSANVASSNLILYRGLLEETKMVAVGFGGVMKSLDWIWSPSIFPESALLFY